MGRGAKGQRAEGTVVMIPFAPGLLQSDCQPWAQHRNSREISAESLSALGSALQLQRVFQQSDCQPWAQHFNSREMLAE